MSVQEFKTKGNEAFKTGKYADAVTWYSKAIQAEPQNETLYSNRAASYSALGQNLEAYKDAETCVSLKPSWVKGHFRKGVALFKLARFEEAVQAYSRALELEPANGDIQAKVNEARAALKKQSEGVTPQSVTDPSECKRIGNANFKDGKYEDAALWYTRAIELTEVEPTEETAVYYTNRAACYAQTHMYKQVVADSTAAITINPKAAKAYLRRAMAYESLEKWQKACDDYRTVMEIEPGTQLATEGFRRAQRFAKECQ